MSLRPIRAVVRDFLPTITAFIAALAGLVHAIWPLGIFR